MMIAIQMPSTVSRTTVAMVKKNVLTTAVQNAAPLVPGGQVALPHCWSSQWV